MKNLYGIVILFLLIGCVNEVREDSYKKVMEECHITKIIQSKRDVKDETNISAIAKRELDLRFEYLEKIVAKLKISTKNGTQYSIDEKEELKQENIKMNKYIFEIYGIIESELLPTDIDDRYATERLNRIYDDDALSVRKMLDALILKNEKK